VTIAPATLTAIVGVCGTIGGVILKSVFDLLTVRRRNRVLRRGLAISLHSYQVGLEPAAARGVADPSKLSPLVDRLTAQLQSETLLALTNDQAFAIEAVVRESAVLIAQLRAAVVRVEKRLETESPPPDTDQTRWYALIEGQPYDPRLADYRREVMQYARPVAELVTAAITSLGGIPK
jgi:hypothetical protein